MLDIKSILTFILSCVSKKDPRFVIKGYEHVTDTKTGITIHMYDRWFKITYDDENVAVQDDFTILEQEVVWKIKEAITPREVLQERHDDYKPLQCARRKSLSDLYQNPTPLNNTEPTEEVGAVAYKG